MDIITYSNDTVALEAELNDAGLLGDDGSFNVQKIGSFRTGDETLALIRADGSLLARIKELSNLRLLAEVENDGDYLADMTTANRALYDAVHDQATIDDGEGGTIEVNHYIGGFA